MASDEPSTRESRVTTDADRIEQWATRHDRIPVVEGDRIRFVPESAYDEDRQERIDWDDFERRLKDSDRVVLYHGEEYRGEPLEIEDRTDAVARFEDEDVEDRLMAGEIVTGTIVETATIERTVVEEAQIESEVVDSEIVDGTIVDAQLLSRECSACTPREADGEGYLDRYGVDYFEGEASGNELAGDDPMEFDLEIEEGWSLTVEELERFTVESRVTEVDVSESDAVEDVDLMADVGTDRIHDHLLESGLFEMDYSDADDADTEVHAIRTETGEGDRMETELTQRRTVDREVAMTHDVDATATESTRTHLETAHEEVVDEGLAERDHDALGGTAVGEAETTDGERRVEPTERDEGKTVVDASGEEIGVVTDVEAGVAYVDPEPSLTDKVMAALGWGDADEEDYSIAPSDVSRITDDEVEVAGSSDRPASERR